MSDPEAQLQNLPKNEEIKSNTDNDSGQINVEYQGIAEATGEDNTEIQKEKEQGVGGQIVNVLRKMTNDFGGRLSRGNSQPDLTENNNNENNNNRDSKRNGNNKNNSINNSKKKNRRRRIRIIMIIIRRRRLMSIIVILMIIMLTGVVVAI